MHRKSRKRTSTNLRGLSRTAHYIGGPLGGQVEENNTYGNTWSLYRDEAGETVATRRGDLEFLTWGKTPTRYYTRQLVGTNALGKRQVVYVHATVWAEWQAQREQEQCDEHRS